jgi:hypothetical protein
MSIWDENAIKRYVDQGIEESLTLDYKASGSLAKTDGKKSEITKDVSAMANSAGGIIIYGIQEHQDRDKRHLPEKIDPIDRSQFSKEWLEQIINNIQPRIDGVIIHAIPITSTPTGVIYIVEIPQSNTAHQATDKRYYKRYNFESIAMEDYEIRDVMNRGMHPKIDLEFEIETETWHTNDPYTTFPPEPITKQTKNKLICYAINHGRVYAQYVNAIILIPAALYLKDNADAERNIRNIETLPDGVYYRDYKENTIRDVVDSQHFGVHYVPKYGPSRYDPILPGRQHVWETELVDRLSLITKGRNFRIHWEVYADNAPLNRGEILLSDIPVINTDNQEH